MSTANLCAVWARVALWMLPMLLGGLFLVTPMWSLHELSWHDQQRLAQAVVLVAVLLGALWWPWRLAKRLSAAPRSAALLMMVFASGAVSALSSGIPTWALLEWSWLAALLVLMLWAANGEQSSRQLLGRCALAACAAFAWMYCFKLIGALAAVYSGMPLSTPEFFDGFSNRRFFGQVATLCVPLLVLGSVHEGAPRRLRLWCGSGAVLLLFAAITSQARGTLWSWAIASILLAVLARAPLSYWKSLGGCAVLGGVLYLTLLWVPAHWLGVSGLEQHLMDTHSSGRSSLWMQAVAAAREQPVLGVGPMGLVQQFSVGGAHPHNSALQIAAEWGLPVALVVGQLLVLGVLRMAGALRKRPADAVGAALFLALTSSLLQSLVDGVFVMPLSQTLLALVAGASIAWMRPVEQCASVAQPWPRVVRPGLVVVLLILLVSFAVTLRAPVNGLRDPEGCEVGQSKPRFWSCGWVTRPTELVPGGAP